MILQDQTSGKCETLNPNSSLQHSILFFSCTQLLPNSHIFVFKEAINLLHPHHLRVCRGTQKQLASLWISITGVWTHQPGEMPSLVFQRKGKWPCSPGRSRGMRVTWPHSSSSSVDLGSPPMFLSSKLRCEPAGFKVLPDFMGRNLFLAVPGTDFSILGTRSSKAKQTRITSWEVRFQPGAVTPVYDSSCLGGWSRKTTNSRPSWAIKSGQGPPGQLIEALSQNVKTEKKSMGLEMWLSGRALA